MSKKLEGTSGWATYTHTGEDEVCKGIVRGNRELDLDVTCDGDCYGVSLKRDGASQQYLGSWEYRADGTMGIVSCRLYRSDDEILLFGVWLEEGKRNHRWARLRVVKHSAREVDAQDGNGNTAGSRSRVKALTGAKCKEEKKSTSPISSTKRVRR